jgi:hypothetical protein
MGVPTGRQHRSTQRHQLAEADRDRALREQLRCFSPTHPCWGYRRAHAQLREAGWSINRKAIQRLSRKEGCGCRSGGASASGWAPPRRQRIGWRPSIPIMCGRWTYQFDQRLPNPQSGATEGSRGRATIAAAAQ